MKSWFMILVLIFCFQSVSYAQQCSKCLSTKVSIPISKPDYQKIARSEAMKNLSQKLYSHVKGKSIFEKQHVHNNMTESLESKYLENIEIHHDVFVIGANEESSYVDDLYILQMQLDFDQSGPAYAQIASSIAQVINDEYIKVQRSDNVYDKKESLQNIRTKFYEYELFRNISFLMGYMVDIKPMLNMHMININIKELSQDIYLDDPIKHYGYEINKKGL